MKISDFKTFAHGNGVPCNGDLIETIINGTKYRAEFYIEDNYGHPCAMLAADSSIEKFENNSWQVVTYDDDDAFNELLAKITPVLED